MFIAIIIIILGASASIIGSMYYNTITMEKTYGTVNGFYGAYYGAMASIERGLLMSKLKYPSYEGSGGFKGEQIYGAASNGFSEDFWKLTQGKNSLMRSVDSRTDTIIGTIDTQTLRSISFDIYQDFSGNDFTGGIRTGSYGVNDGLIFTGKIDPRTPNIGVIQQDSQQTGLGETVDFNRFFSLKQSDYIVRGLKTTDTYGQNNQVYDAEGEKDFQLTGNFEFNSEKHNPWPALSGELSDGYLNH